nr:MAG TPA: putative tail component [Caudoviricetes sp.]
MISFNCNIKVKHNFKNIEAITKKLPQKAKEITEDVLNNIRGYAIKLEKGHNENGILVEMIDMSTKEVKGRVYADPSKFMSNGVSYLFFEYFGTGANAEMEHVGKTKHFIQSGYTEWFIPVSKIEKALSYPVVNIQKIDFYIAHGSKANHFMSDASFQSREENVEVAKKKIEEMLKEVCK